MFAVHQDKLDRLTGHMPQESGGAVLAPLALIGNRLGFHKAIRRFQDERRRRAMIRELNRLNDYYLDDIGIDRSEIDSIAAAAVERLRK